MSITIYWACEDDSWLRAKPPESVYKAFCKDLKNKKNDLILCPATKDYMNNVFSLKSLFDYQFTLGPDEQVNEVFADRYDQDFFNSHVWVRSREDRLFSFFQKFVFFTEEKSLLMSGGILPFLENNNITDRCTIIPGTFDIGKWFRQLDFAFYLKENYNEFKIEEDDIFQYIKFHTKEKIIFKQFKMNAEIKECSIDSDGARRFRQVKLRNLEDYYSMMRNKKNLLRLIKNNLLD
jgi:hypothetical protein